MEDAEAPRVAQAKEDSLELELRVHQLPSAVMMVRLIWMSWTGKT